MTRKNIYLMTILWKDTSCVVRFELRDAFPSLHTETLDRTGSVKILLCRSSDGNCVLWAFPIHMPELSYIIRLLFLGS